MVDTISNKRKKGSINEEDICSLLPKYSATQVLALLREVAQSSDVKIDWNSLVKKSSIGIDNARECQLLWRHLAYRQPLIDTVELGAQPLDDDSDLEYEVEACPAVSTDVLLEAAQCVKVLAVGSPNESLVPNNSTVEGDIPNGQSSQVSSEHPHPSLPHCSNMSLPASVQKQPQSAGISGEGLDVNGISNSNYPSRRRRKPWSEEEDLELINAVRKHGEGIWATIVKSEFNGNRTASQLSQRWAILKKKQGSINVGVNVSPFSEQHLATRHALEQALKNTSTANCGTVSNGAAGTSHATNLNVSNKDSPVINDVAPMPSQQLAQASNTSVKLKPVGSTMTPRPLPRKVPVKPTVTTDSIQATAVAVGARIVSDSESLVRVAQAKKAIHIRGGGSSIKSSVSGSSGILPPNVHFIRTGLAAGTPSPAVGHQAKSNVVKPSVPTVSVPQLSGAKLEKTNATPSGVHEFQEIENKISGEVKTSCSDKKLAKVARPPQKGQSASPCAVDIEKASKFEDKVCRKATENHILKEDNEKASIVNEGHEVLPSLVVDEDVEETKALSKA